MFKSLYSKANESFGRHGIILSILLWVIAPGAVATVMAAFAARLAWFWKALHWFGVIAVFLLAWMTIGVIVYTWIEIATHYRRRNKQRQPTPPEWKNLIAAIETFCDPHLVWKRRSHQSHRESCSEKVSAIQAEMRQLYDAVPGGGFRDRPDDLEKYKKLSEQLERYSEVSEATAISLRYDWEYLRDDVRERLLSEELIAQGFVEPYKGGDGAVLIKQSEWRLLDINPYAGTAVKKDKPSTIVYAGVHLARVILPALEITFDPSNPERKFWSLESNKDENGNQIAGAHWEYRAQIKNKSPQTLRNVKVAVEAVGPMPSRPEPSHFDINKERLININPDERVLAIIRRWWNPPIVVGMVCGGAYGPIKMTVSADDVRPVSKLFWFDPELTPMIAEITFS